MSEAATTMSSDLVPDKPVVDEARIRRIHKELRSMPAIDLDADPLAVGPKAMNNKKAAISNQLRRCTALQLQLLEDRGWFEHELAREKGKYEIAYTDLLAHNPHVRAGRSTADREAAARVILAESVVRIKELELSVEDLERLLVAVKTKVTDLRNKQAQLRDQLKICEHELGLGAHWGQPTGAAYPMSKPEAVTADDVAVVDDLIAQVDAADNGDLEEESEESEEEESEEEEPEEEGSEEEGSEEEGSEEEGSEEEGSEESEEEEPEEEGSEEEGSEEEGSEEEGSEEEEPEEEGSEEEPELGHESDVMSQLDEDGRTLLDAHAEEDILPSTTTAEEVDTFLEGLDVEDAEPEPPSDPGSIDVDTILEGLEYDD